MSTPMVIRPASAEEIDEIVAIDDDACALYERAGLHIDLNPEHPFARSEWARWTQAAREGNAFFAEGLGARAVGLLVMGRVDGAPYLEQLSVRTNAMRQGIGTRLLTRAIERAAGEALWLTTYAHLPWNRPFYERAGFAVIPESQCPKGIVEILEEQRRWLPAPRERIAMRRPGNEKTSSEHE
jgi:GNAT superfamily N-acetyltransferase